MWPISTAAQEVIRSSQSIAIRGTAFGPSGQQYSNLPISGGVVTDDSTSQTRRIATVYIADVSLWPETPTDVLAPFGAELLIEYGISIPGAGIEWVPLIRGLLTDTDQTIPSVSQGITLTLADRSQRVKDDRLIAPLQVGGSGTVVAAIKALILSTYPTATIIDQTGDTTACPLHTVQQDKWADGVEPLALSIGAEVYFDPVGTCIIRYQPTLSSNPVWMVDTGTRGILVSNERKRSRTDVYNQVIAQGESSTGTTSVTATVTDLDPTSPTYYNGNFGHKPRFYISPTLGTVAQCTAAGTAILARAKGNDAQVTLQTLTNPALQSGDVVQLQGSTGNALHIMDSVTCPLDLTAIQQMVGRTTVLPAEQTGSTTG